MSARPGPSGLSRRPERDRTRVLRVIARLNVGGPAIQAITLTRRLVDRGYETLLVRGVEDSYEGSMDSLAERLEVRPVLVPWLRRGIGLHDAWALWALLRLTWRAAPDLLHTHASKAGALARVAALVAGPRGPRVTVHTFHGHVLTGYFPSGKERLFRRIERWLSVRTDILVAVSEEVRQDLLMRGIAPPERVTVIPLGFDLSPFQLASEHQRRLREATRARLGIAGHERTVTLVARLVQIKRVDRFLRIAARLTDMPGVRFLIVGDGELRNELRSSAEATVLGDRLIWAGLEQDMPAVCCASDVVVLTSDNEGTPVSLIEAQAAGLPVVTTSVGGVASVVSDGQTGRVVASGNEAGFAAAVRAYLEDPELAAQCGAEGARRSAERFSLPRLLDDIDGLYRRLLDGAGG